MKIGAIIWEMSKLEEPAALWQKGDGGLVSESVFKFKESVPPLGWGHFCFSWRPCSI